MWALRRASVPLRYYHSTFSGLVELTLCADVGSNVSFYSVKLFFVVGKLKKVGFCVFHHRFVLTFLQK